MTNFKKIMIVLLLTLALGLSTTVVYAEEVLVKPSAVTTGNTDVSPEILHLMVRHMHSDELFVEADGWLDLLKGSAKKVYDTKRAVQKKNTEIDALKALDTNQTVSTERERIQKKVTVAKEEKSLLLEELTKSRAQRKTMVSRLDTVLESVQMLKVKSLIKYFHTADISIRSVVSL